MSRRKKRVFSGIGGQALLEGIMMKNKDEYSVAVRQPDGKINVQKWPDESVSGSAKVLKKIPFVRGVVNFIDSLKLGMKTLTYSASFYEDTEEEQETKFDKFLEKKFGDKTEKVVMGVTVAISVIFAVGLFMILPYVISELLSNKIQNPTLIAVIEGVLRLVIFLVYICLISLMKDIKRVYQYHGAEHKCINCIEKGKTLTVRNVMRCSRLHPRCGTSFLLLVMVITIILFFFIRVESVPMRMLIRILLIPVIAGVSYEILSLAGKADNVFTKIISAPGMLLQKLTTREPEEEMVEVAIAAIEKVFDWESFQEKNFSDKKSEKTSDKKEDEE